MSIRTFHQARRVLTAPLGLLVLALPASAQFFQFEIPLTDAQEVPPTGTGAIGHASIFLDASTGDVNVNGLYQNLSSNQTLAHIHGPAPAGMNAGIIMTLTGTGGTLGSFSGSTTLNASQVSAMVRGQYYVNIHSMTFGNGEIRGQICKQADAVGRNAGLNPSAYACSAPVFGGTLTATVNMGFTGHSFAMLFAFDTPVDITLAGGQHLLCLDLGGSGEIFTGSGLGPSAPPVGSIFAPFSAPVPNNLSLCNFTFSSQAMLFGGVTPFALSNANDMTLGF